MRARDTGGRAVNVLPTSSYYFIVYARAVRVLVASSIDRAARRNVLIFAAAVAVFRYKSEVFEIPKLGA